MHVNSVAKALHLGQSNGHGLSQSRRAGIPRPGPLSVELTASVRLGICRRPIQRGRPPGAAFGDFPRNGQVKNPRRVELPRLDFVREASQQLWQVIGSIVPRISQEMGRHQPEALLLLRPLVPSPGNSRRLSGKALVKGSLDLLLCHARCRAVRCDYRRKGQSR